MPSYFLPIKTLKSFDSVNHETMLVGVTVRGSRLILWEDKSKTLSLQIGKGQIKLKLLIYILRDHFKEHYIYKWAISLGEMFQTTCTQQTNLDD